MTEQEKAAWMLYCIETQDSLDVKDFWWELSDKVQAHFIAKVNNIKEEQ